MGRRRVQVARAWAWLGGGRGWWGVCLAVGDVGLGYGFEVGEGVAVGGSRGRRIRGCCGGSSLCGGGGEGVD